MTFEHLWIAFGLLGQGVFAARFLVQWIASERRRESHIPLIFWYLSLGGGIMLTAYAIHKKDPVFIIGQGSGLVVYIRNLMLIYRRKRHDAERTAAQTASPDRA